MVYRGDLHRVEREEREERVGIVQSLLIDGVLRAPLRSYMPLPLPLLVQVSLSLSLKAKLHRKKVPFLLLLV